MLALVFAALTFVVVSLLWKRPPHAAPRTPTSVEVKLVPALPAGSNKEPPAR